MQSEKKQNKINETIETTLKNLSTIIDANTVFGSPLKTESGEIIIPVSKITVGILSGGGEYGKLGIFNSSSDLPFSAGNGAVVSVKPCGFLLKENDKFKLLNVAGNSYEKLIDKVSDFISELKDEKNI
ncbi:MAG: sporulation protein YtfJ [Clostridia bacterium]|nr:sporulation protein YtfJ [Clostridia bacterium]